MSSSDISARVEEAGLEHDIEHGIGRGDRQRIAAEGRAVEPASCRGGFRGGKHRADRETAAERLGERHHVGHEAEAR